MSMIFDNHLHDDLMMFLKFNGAKEELINYVQQMKIDVADLVVQKPQEDQVGLTYTKIIKNMENGVLYSVGDLAKFHNIPYGNMTLLLSRMTKKELIKTKWDFDRRKYYKGELKKDEK